MPLSSPTILVPLAPPLSRFSSQFSQVELLKRMSFGRKNGYNMGTITGTDYGDNIEESILAISFSNKASKYTRSRGSGQVVRIWDLPRKLCIKWIKGHTNTVAGVMYNCNDEHLASISISIGEDLIIHNLASGQRAAELTDPNKQVFNASWTSLKHVRQVWAEFFLKLYAERKPIGKKEGRK